MGSHRSLAVVLLLGALAGPPAIATPAVHVAQTDPVPGQAHQRAPGVPLAPDPAETGRSGSEARRGDDVLYRDRAEQGRRAATPGPSRDPPMPKPVPSIIQN